MHQVEKTKDYEKFHILQGNRPIDKYHLKKLTASIQKNNHLNLHPIVVNENFEVIDGQHRLAVCKILGLEVFYVKSDSVKDEHLIECNVNQKSFEVDNYINFYATKEKKPEYIRMQKMLKTSGLKPKAILTLLLGTVSSNILEFIKTGKFIFPDDISDDILDFYLRFKGYCQDKRIRPLSIFTNHNFTRALRWIYKTTGFEEDVLFKKLDMRWFDLKPQRTSEDWYSLLISIYNFKSHQKIESEYGKEN